MKRTRTFRDRYAKYLRTRLHKPETIIWSFDDWFCLCKVLSSNPINRPVGGCLDPLRLETLFTPDTKIAVKNCKENAKHLSHPLPLEEMCALLLPNPNPTHQLTEHLPKRGESKLEAFHDRFAHFANCGMIDALADNLNLADSARHNLAIRHKRSLVSGGKNQIKNFIRSRSSKKDFGRMGLCGSILQSFGAVAHKQNGRYSWMPTSISKG